MEITLNQDTRMIDIVVHEDQISDDLLGVLPEPTNQAEGCLAWSIRFGDVTRTPRNSAGVAEDELLGPVGAIVGPIASQGSSLGLRSGFIPIWINSIAEDSTFIEPLRTTFRDSESAPLVAIRRLQEEFMADLAALAPVRGTRNSEGSIDRTDPIQPAFSIAPNQESLVLLFANPFA